MDTYEKHQRLRLWLITGVLLLLPVSFASAAPIAYEAYLKTSLGNPVTDILILESNGHSVQATVYPETLPGSGVVFIRHNPAIDPLRTLVIGLTEGEEAGIVKTQLVMFLDPSFAAASQEIPFSTVFPGIRHSETLARLQAAVAGDTTELAWFTDVFFAGPATTASFSSRGSFRVVEFSRGHGIGGSLSRTPLFDARILALLTLLLAGLGARRLSRI